MGIDAQFDLSSATILPDCVMQHNRFAMWLATGSIDAAVHFGNERTKVRGTVFYDHPRINLEANDVAGFGWYHYTPMSFSDGSRLAAYYTVDRQSRTVEDYSFGVYIDPAGCGTWLPRAEMVSLACDGEDKPCAWVSRWSAPGMEIDLRARSKPTRVLRAWGGPQVAQTRKENTNIPIVFDCEGAVRTSGSARAIAGGGVAECTTWPGLVPKV